MGLVYPLQVGMLVPVLGILPQNGELPKNVGVRPWNLYLY